MGALTDFALRLERGKDRRLEHADANVEADDRPGGCWRGTARANPRRRNCSSVVSPPMPESARLATIMPSGAPACAKLVKNPRRFFGAHSLAISTDPLHSPPTARPCIARKNVSRTALHEPIDAIRRHEAHRHRRNPHRHHRDDEQRFPADAVAEVAEERRAERTRHEADEERRERQDLADDRIGRREEQFWEDQRGRRAVEKEVVPLDCRADGRGDDCSPQVALAALLVEPRPFVARPSSSSDRHLLLSELRLGPGEADAFGFGQRPDAETGKNAQTARPARCPRRNWTARRRRR